MLLYYCVLLCSSVDRHDSISPKHIIQIYAMNYGNCFSLVENVINQSKSLVSVPHHRYFTCPLLYNLYFLCNYIMPLNNVIITYINYSQFALNIMLL